MFFIDIKVVLNLPTDVFNDAFSFKIPHIRRYNVLLCRAVTVTSGKTGAAAPGVDTNNGLCCYFGKVFIDFTDTIAAKKQPLRFFGFV